MTTYIVRDRFNTGWTASRYLKGYSQDQKGLIH